MMSKEFFVLLFMDWSMQIAGKTTQESIDKYSSDSGKLKVIDPVLFWHGTIQDKRGQQRLQSGIREIYPLPTDQKEMIFDANGLEIVSEIAKNEGGEYLIDGTAEVKQMYSEYQKFIDAKRMRNSKIVPPSSENVSEINKYKVKL